MRKKLNINTAALSFLSTLTCLFLSSPARAATPILDLVSSHYGRVDFFTSGASFTDPKNLQNGAECLLDEATLTIPAFTANESPTLVAAYLYWSGSLFSDDQDNLFVTNDLSCKNEYQQDIDCDPRNPDHLPTFMERAKQSADNSVDLLLPGQSTAHTITADNISMSGYYKSAGEDRGINAFFMAKADITGLLAKELKTFSGNYTLRGLTADICNGQEALCSQNQTCSNMSDPHVNAHAAFSLVLVLQDPTWRLRRVALYQGLHGLNYSQANIKLENISISDPPNGKLSYYVLEGDNTLDSQSEEWVKVDGGAGEMLLTDSLNPVGNPYNGTINNNNITGIAGVDIDQFDISSSLAAGAKEVNVTFSTGVDRIVLGAVNVSVAVFSPVLEYNSTLTLVDDYLSNINDPVPALAPVPYIATLVNNGNLDADDATFTLVIPENVKSWSIEQIPAGAIDKSMPNGGKGYGLINVQNIKVPTGDVAQIRFSIVPTCAARQTPIVLTATTTYNGTDFKMSSPAVRVTDDKGQTCPPLNNPTPIDPNQPLFWQKLGLRLEGGGGCNGLDGGSLWPLLLLLPMLVKKKDEKG